MQTLVAINLAVLAVALPLAIFWPRLSTAWANWRAKSADPPDKLDETEMDAGSKKLISAAKALLIARNRAEDNPRLKAKIEDALACLPDFVCTKGAA